MLGEDPSFHRIREAQLSHALTLANEEYKAALQNLDAALSNVPSGMPSTDGTLLIERVGRERSTAFRKYMAALREWSDFVLGAADRSSNHPVEDASPGHFSDEALEEYSLDRLADYTVVVVREHLLFCDYCRARLEGIEPVNLVHFTEDGPVYSRATRLTIGKVMVRHWGAQLEHGKVCGSVSAASGYLSESFAQMYPEHRCEGRCGPAKEHGKPR